MKNLEPKNFRQRLIVEAKYSAEITPEKLEEFLLRLSENIKMNIIIGPIVKNLAERINPVHEGYEAVLVWAESGAQLYTWSKFKFLTLDVYTCVRFTPRTVVEFTEEFFECSETVYKEIVSSN